MKRTLLALALSTAALSANAADLNYNYVQGSYNSVDIDGTDLDGFGIKGSLKFNDSFYGIAGYESYSEGSAGLDEYNIGLGERRAQTVRKALLLQGVSEAQITTVSYGEERPAVEGSTEEAHAQNRRVELVQVQ